MTATAFTFTKIHVGDLAAQERFYCGVLGLTPAARISGGEGKSAFEEVVLSVGDGGGGAQLILVQLLNVAPPPAGEAVTGFMVVDIAATVAAAVAAGGAIVHPVQDVAEHGLRVAYVRDPEGHVIELLQTLAA